MALQRTSSAAISNATHRSQQLCVRCISNTCIPSRPLTHQIVTSRAALVERSATARTWALKAPAERPRRAVPATSEVGAAQTTGGESQRRAVVARAAGGGSLWEVRSEAPLTIFLLRLPQGAVAPPVSADIRLRGAPPPPRVTFGDVGGGQDSHAFSGAPAPAAPQARAPGPAVGASAPSGAEAWVGYQPGVAKAPACPLAFERRPRVPPVTLPAAAVFAVRAGVCSVAAA